MKKIVLLITAALGGLVAHATEQDPSQDTATVITQAITRGSMLTSNNSAQFDTFIKGSNQPIIIKFYAPWCPSCRTIHNTFVALSQQYAGKVIFINANTDQHRDLLNRYKIMRIPTFITFKNGTLLNKILGPTANELNAIVATLAQ